MVNRKTETFHKILVIIVLKVRMKCRGVVDSNMQILKNVKDVVIGILGGS